METENLTATVDEKKPFAAPKQKITLFLWFDGQAEEAVDFYSSVIGNCKKESTMPGPGGLVMSATFRIKEQKFIAFNGGPMFRFSPAISFFLPCETATEINEIWAKLSAGGKVLMPVDKYPFSEKYGWVEDRFGISWQLMLSDTSQTISPSLLFVGNQKGKAEEAMLFYTSIFENSGISQIERYGEEDMDPTGTIKYGSFSISGQKFVAMDSSMEHDFGFTPAISLFVTCDTQPEIDRFWESLSEGGEKNRCGWLQDKYGISWQIVPPVLGEMLSDPDREKSNRVMQAMLQMDKLIISDLEKAYNTRIRNKLTNIKINIMETKEIKSRPQAVTEAGDLIIERVFDLPVSKVWQAWTEPESMKKWWGPKDYTCPVCTMDLKVGGKYLNCMRSAEGDEFWSTGVYKEIIPEKKLVLTDSFSDEKGNVVPASALGMPGNWPLELRLTISFEENEGKTTMELMHEGLPAEMREDCRTGWQQSFDKLEENLK